MIHAYARLSFNVTRDADYPTSCKVSKLVLKPAAGNCGSFPWIGLHTGNAQS
jgi:hypothetical protein